MRWFLAGAGLAFAAFLALAVVIDWMLRDDPLPVFPVPGGEFV